MRFAILLAEVRSMMPPFLAGFMQEICLDFAWICEDEIMRLDET